jgi:hypothetical protein
VYSGAVDPLLTSFSGELAYAVIQIPRVTHNRQEEIPEYYTRCCYMILKGGVWCAVSATRITGYTLSDTIKFRGIMG